MRRWMKQIMVWLVAAACGFAAALVICRWSGTAFGLFMWSVIAAGAGFVVAGVGFFPNRRKRVRFSTESVRRHVCSA